jgi:hypothetical protein
MMRVVMFFELYLQWLLAMVVGQTYDGRNGHTMACGGGRASRLVLMLAFR